MKRLRRLIVLFLKKLGFSRGGLLCSSAVQFLTSFRFQRCIKKGEPYFGHYLAATQGTRRHYYMQKILENYSKQTNNEPVLILEIGSWAGGSAITWAEALKKYCSSNGRIFCIDPWKSYNNIDQLSLCIRKVMQKALMKEKIFNLFLHNIKTTNNDDVVCPLRGRSDEILPLLRPNQFDIIYIDGSHDYKDVLMDLNNSAPLLRDGGILCGDDLELQSFEIDLENALKHINEEYIEDGKTRRTFHVGVTFAVAETIGKVSSWEGFWAVRKNGNSWNKINIENLDLNNIEVPVHLK